jgi:hypothetical protein
MKKRCANCSGRLGLGMTFRNLWNGRWWVHLRLCSAICQHNYELELRQETQRNRWLTFLARGSPT